MSRLLIHGPMHPRVHIHHSGSFPPDCSATMYAAYQSGQFASRCPMRFSCSPWAASARRNALARSLSEPKEVAPGSTRLGSQFGDCFIQRLLVPADNRDFSAFCNEKAGGGQADAAEIG